MKNNFDYDVIVLGGGPGGTSSAIRLATLGLNVAIVESASFPRAHVGICISDQSLELFSYLDLGDKFQQARFWRRNLTAVNWGETETKLVSQKGFHVDRAILDQLMLNKARAVGVTIYHPAQVLNTVSLQPSGWQIDISKNIGTIMLTGRFIVDAAGRRPALNGPRIKDAPPLVAFYAKWDLEHHPEFDGLIESGEDAWLWYAQTDSNQAIVSIFCDPRQLGSRKAVDLQSIYCHLLEQFDVLDFTRIGRQSTNPLGCDARSQHSGDPVSSCHIRVGDACHSVDPLSSQGVHLALQSGLQAAVIIHTILKKPENTELAIQFYQTRVAEHVNRHADRTRLEYSRVSAVRAETFWHERSGGASMNKFANIPPTTDRPHVQSTLQVTVANDATNELAPVIENHFVEQRQVLKHPNIKGAVAYIHGANLIELLSVLPKKFAYRKMPMYWQNHVSAGTARKIAAWLWDNGVIIEAT